jgi:hypothetical protein
MNAVLDVPNYTDAVITDYDVDALKIDLLRYAAPTRKLLDSITLDQLLTVKKLEELAVIDETQASISAQDTLKTTKWPQGLSATEMDYDLFYKHFIAGVSGDVAFYYYIFDKCIPRRSRNKTANYMLRLATFAKASFRELWEEDQTWNCGGLVFKLAPNKQSSKKKALLPKSGEFAPDHQVVLEGRPDKIYIEEKPWHTTDVAAAFDKWGDAKSCYGAKYLMVYCEANNKFYLYDWRKKSYWEMTPASSFPGYPDGFKNIY